MDFVSHFSAWMRKQKRGAEKMKPNRFWEECEVWQKKTSRMESSFRWKGGQPAWATHAHMRRPHSGNDPPPRWRGVGP